MKTRFLWKLYGCTSRAKACTLPVLTTWCKNTWSNSPVWQPCRPWWGQNRHAGLLQCPTLSGCPANLQRCLEAWKTPPSGGCRTSADTHLYNQSHHLQTFHWSTFYAIWTFVCSISEHPGVTASLRTHWGLWASCIRGSWDTRLPILLPLLG